MALAAWMGKRIVFSDRFSASPAKAGKLGKTALWSNSLIWLRTVGKSSGPSRFEGRLTHSSMRSASDKPLNLQRLPHTREDIDRQLIQTLVGQAFS